MLHIVRHGRTEMNASGKLLGRLNPELDDVGVQQAESLAKSFKKVDILISSPLLRTYQTAEAFGVSMAINENLSISYNQHNMTYTKQGAGPDVEQESTGIAIAYTMGGASIAIQNNSQDNSSGTANSNDEITEVSLSMAF